MKQLSIFFMLIVTALFSSCNNASTGEQQTVNPIIGDASFVQKFGYQPNRATDDQVRIKTHLEYAESLLRQKDVSKLPLDLKKQRTTILDHLHDYWNRGIFPKNYDYTDQRKPCFIDKDGTICAVGYLIEQTTNRQVAEGINNQYKYAEVLAMNDPTVDNWVGTSGLTKEECALIQPSYTPSNFVYSNNYVSPQYGISSAVLGGLSVSLNTINGIQIANGAKGKVVPIIGLVTGTSQIIIGAKMFPKKEIYWGSSYSNETRKAVSMVNIGLGSATMILSAWNLITNRKPKEKLACLNIYSFPTPNNKTGLALNLTKRF